MIHGSCACAEPKGASYDGPAVKGEGEGRYFVLPPSMENGIDDDTLDTEDLIYDIDPTLVGGAGAEAVSPASIMKMEVLPQKEGCDGGALRDAG